MILFNIAICLLFSSAAIAYGQQNSCSLTSQVRLVNGTNEREGRVEVCGGGEWGTVCDDLWDSRDAEVVCRMLGFEINGAIAAAGSYFGQGTGPILLDGLECVGDEEELGLCPHLGYGTHDCSHMEDAAVICQPANYSCEEGAVRLVGGERETEGRVEICFGSQFGTICDDGWDSDDAAVICGQLGFSREGAIGVTRTAPFGIGIGFIYLVDVACDGNEANITSCPHRQRGNSDLDCRHKEDASVLCKPLGTPTLCSNGEVRLAGGRHESEGRVEICYNERWGTVCDDLWEISDAGVVCSQRGFPRTGAIAVGVNAFGPGTGPVFLDNLLCRGDEISLGECFSSEVGQHNCDHAEDAGVICRDPDLQCQDGSVRLVDGVDGSPNEGRVEICMGDHWGTVCDDSWSNEDAAVVCNQMGYPGPSLALPHSFFGKGRGVTWITTVQCSGDEISLLSCNHQGYNIDTCNHEEDASVICTRGQEEGEVYTPICENGQVRLVNGSVANEGRVEVCFNDYWGTVCIDSWDDVDASVVCRQLGYEGEGSLATRDGFFGEGSGPILLDDVLCTGNESFLLQCPSANQIGASNCVHSQDVGVICPVRRELRICENGDVRLNGGSSKSEGRVEICINSRWGTVCQGSTTTWNENGAGVVCRQLGFNSETTRGIPTFGSFGIGTGPIFLNNIRCFGDEDNLLQCPSSGIKFITDCDHSRDVGVVCSNIPCVEHTLRLVGGSEENGSSSAGRLQVCVDGRYGAVSSRGFERNHAMAVCRQLGFESENFRLLHNSSVFGSNKGEDVYSLLISAMGVVNGTELVKERSQNTDVSLICLGPFDDCLPGAVRLVGGKSALAGGKERPPSEGRVEVCLGNQWGTVCDDSWDNRSSAVVCNQLGLPSEGSRVKSFGGNDDIMILLDDVKCDGTESDLLLCRGHTGTNDCTHYEDVGVECRGQTWPGNDTEVDTSDHDAESLLVSVMVPVLVLIIAVATVLMMISILVVYSKSRTKAVILSSANSFVIERGSDSLKFSERSEICSNSKE